MVKFFANAIWFYLPTWIHKVVSKVYSSIYQTSLSRLIVVPYSLASGLDQNYLSQFIPESGGQKYKSYSDFFKRKYKMPPILESNTIWPCEGYVCDWGHFNEKNFSVVKGQKINLNSIFQSDDHITHNYFFINIFLHSHNYHRVHSPINGVLSKITRISGDLVFLRPWFYNKEDVSYPAFRNERYIFEILDADQKPWYLAMVGGFAVGTIEMSPELTIGSKITVGQELGKFNLGSTVCLASPREVKINSYLETVCVGKKFDMDTRGLSTFDNIFSDL